MQKSIGLSRTVRLDWLDATASLCLVDLPLAELRDKLDTLLETAQPGPQERARIVDTLVRIWVRALPDLKQEGLSLYRHLTTREDRLWLHYGMILAQYPFFRLATAAIGQISRTEDFITRPVVRSRVMAEMGNLGSIERAVERLFKSLLDWEVILPRPEPNLFKIQTRSCTAATPQVETWLLACALRGHPADALPFEDLLHLPELYPFRFSVVVDILRQDPRFDVNRQGSGLDMVRLRQCAR